MIVRIKLLILIASGIVLVLSIILIDQYVSSRYCIDAMFTHSECAING